MPERVKLSYADAVNMLPDGDTIHTFVNGGFCIIGADWDRDDILELLKNGEPELSGAAAESMGHGIVALDRDIFVFIETKDTGD